MRDDPYETIFSQRTRSPALNPITAEPFMGRLVVNVHWIEECNEHVDVQQSLRSSTPRPWLTFRWAHLQAELQPSLT